MKNYAPFFTAITSLVSFVCFAQNDKIQDAKNPNTEVANQKIIGYHVEERVNMNFGGHVTTYTVSDLSLVSTTALGPNSRRIITPKYAKVRTASRVTNHVAKIAAAESVAKPEAIVAVMESKNLNTADIAIVSAVAPDNKPLETVEEDHTPKPAYVNVLNTYERVLEGGYRSEDMLKSVGDGRFFDGNLEVAAKWYSELFKLNLDLEAVYYYRYAQALASISETKKSNEMMEIFRSKNM